MEAVSYPQLKCFEAAMIFARAEGLIVAPETSHAICCVVDEALKAKEEGKPFSAVIMDLTIPGGMGGKETISELKVYDVQVKAIVSSGYSNDPVMANFKDYGFSGVVIKPYRMDELSQVLRSVIEEGKTV